MKKTCKLIISHPEMQEMLKKLFKEKLKVFSFQALQVPSLSLGLESSISQNIRNVFRVGIFSIKNIRNSCKEKSSS